MKFDTASGSNGNDLLWLNKAYTVALLSTTDHGALVQVVSRNHVDSDGLNLMKPRMNFSDYNVAKLVALRIVGRLEILGDEEGVDAGDVCRVLTDAAEEAAVAMESVTRDGFLCFS